MNIIKVVILITTLSFLTQNAVADYSAGEDKSQVKLQDKLLINYILNEIIDVFQETLIIANDPIDYMQSDKISITKDFKNHLMDLYLSQ